MNAITYTAARQNLAKTMDSVCENNAPVIITRQKAEPVVMMSLSDFNSIQETAYLLSNPANAERLRASVTDAESGKVVNVPLEDL
jgi:antitoxin YefM